MPIRRAGFLALAFGVATTELLAPRIALAQTYSFNTLYNFNGASGDGPGTLVYGSNGDIYGTTYNQASVFQISSNNSVSVFDNGFDSATTGYAPLGVALDPANGLLYGVTQMGGPSDGGSIFTFNTSSDAVSFVVSSPSFNPLAPVFDPSGNLFSVSPSEEGSPGDIVQIKAGSTTPTSRRELTCACGQSDMDGRSGRPRSDIADLGHRRPHPYRNRAY